MTDNDALEAIHRIDVRSRPEYIELRPSEKYRRIKDDLETIRKRLGGA